jgi:hypothetical protein
MAEKGGAGGRQAGRQAPRLGLHRLAQGIQPRPESLRAVLKVSEVAAGHEPQPLTAHRNRKPLAEPRAHHLQLLAVVHRQLELRAWHALLHLRDQIRATNPVAVCATPTTHPPNGSAFLECEPAFLTSPSLRGPAYLISNQSTATPSAALTAAGVQAAQRLWHALDLALELVGEDRVRSDDARGLN